jgi:hypothetical protein
MLDENRKGAERIIDAFVKSAVTGKKVQISPPSVEEILALIEAIVKVTEANRARRSQLGRN